MVIGVNDVGRYDEDDVGGGGGEVVLDVCLSDVEGVKWGNGLDEGLKNFVEVLIYLFRLWGDCVSDGVLIELEVLKYVGLVIVDSFVEVNIDVVVIVDGEVCYWDFVVVGMNFGVVVKIWCWYLFLWLFNFGDDFDCCFL